METSCDHIIGYYSWGSYEASGEDILRASDILDDEREYDWGDGPSFKRATLVKALAEPTFAPGELFNFCPKCGTNLTQFHLENTFKP
jgi:hypothetical protein